MPSAEASGAICVQRFDGSRNSAIHTTYRISLRSSSIREPRYPLLRVVFGWSGQAAEPDATMASEQVGVWSGLVRYKLPTHISKQIIIFDWERRPPDLKLRQCPSQGTGARRGRTSKEGRGQAILPQVHLRKPCYDFSFL